VILITVGYRPFPPSIWGKTTTFFEILLIVVVLVLAVTGRQELAIAKEVCGFVVAAFVLISGLHYAIIVSRRLQSGQ